MLKYNVIYFSNKIYGSNFIDLVFTLISVVFRAEVRALNRNIQYTMNIVQDNVYNI